MVGVYLLVRLQAVRQDLGNVLWYLSRLAHVDGCSLQLVRHVRERQVAKTAVDFLPLKWSNNQPALTLLARTTSTSKTVNVRLTVTRETHLNDVSDIWEVHTAGRHIRREQNARLGEAEVVCSPCALSLSQLGVNLEATETRESIAALEATAKLVEYRGSERDFGGAIEIGNGLETAAFTSLGLLVLLEHELVESGNSVLKTRHQSHVLGNSLVGGCLVFVDALGKVEVGAQSLTNQVHDIARNSSREHEVLALRLGWVRKKRPDLINLLLETLVEQAVGLVHDERV